MRELNAALTELRRPTTRCDRVIITGAGDRIFCAGADLGSAFSGGDVDDLHPVRQQRDAQDRALPQAGHRRHQRPRAGRRVRDRDGAATSGCSRRRRAWGRPSPTSASFPATAARSALPRLIGRTKALEYPDPRHADPRGGVPGARARQPALQGRRDAQRRQGAGPPAGQARRRIATRLIIEAVDEGLEAPIDEGSSTSRCAPSCRRSAREDAAEGIQAFFAKREPEFKGR